MKKNFATVGNSTSLGVYKGLEGELSFTSDTRELSVHDGVTSGGRKITLIKSDSGEPSTVPDHLNELYINTEDNALYVSTGTTSANDWKLVSAESQDISGSLLVDTIGDYQSALTPEEQEKVTDALIAADTIRGKQVANETLTAQKFQADTITSREIATGTILADNIKANELSSSAGVFGVISVGDLGAGTISASNIFLGSSRFHFDGGNEVITVNDENGTLRTKYGKLGAGTTDYGIEIYDDTGTLLLSSGGSGSAFTTGGGGAQLGVDLEDEAGNLLFDADFVSSFNKLTSSNIGTYLNSAAITDAYIDTLAANKIAAGTIAASNIFIGDSNFELDGAASQIVVTDTQTTPVERVRLGKLGTNDYGIQIRDAAGADVLRVSDTFTELNADYITTGTLDADRIEGGTLQLTSGMSVTNSSGTTIVDSNGVVANQIWIGSLSGAGSLAQQSFVSNSDVTSIDGGKIFTNSITSNKLNVNDLSAITADLGTVTAGDISALTIYTDQINTDASGSITFNNPLRMSSNAIRDINSIFVDYTYYLDGRNAIRDGFSGNMEIGGGFTQIDCKNDFNVQGTLSKTSGSFDIKHPDPEKTNQRLRHCFVESPTEGDNLYTYKCVANTENETVEINLPSYWKWLNKNPRVWVQAQQQFAHAYAWVDESLEKLFVTCEKPGTYDVLLIGTRCDENVKWFEEKGGVEYYASS